MRGGADGQFVAGGIASETDQVLTNIASVRKMAGCTLGDVVKIMVWLRDRGDFGAFKGAHGKHFSNDLPARSAPESPLMIDIAVEIEAVAFKPL